MYANGIYRREEIRLILWDLFSSMGMGQKMMRKARTDSLPRAGNKIGGLVWNRRGKKKI